MFTIPQHQPLQGAQSDFGKEVVSKLINVTILARKQSCHRETTLCCCNFPTWWSAAILDLIELEIVPFDPLTLKTLP